MFSRCHKTWPVGRPALVFSFSGRSHFCVLYMLQVNISGVFNHVLVSDQHGFCFSFFLWFLYHFSCLPGLLGSSLLAELLRDHWGHLRWADLVPHNADPLVAHHWLRRICTVGRCPPPVLAVQCASRQPGAPPLSPGVLGAKRGSQKLVIDE